MTQLFCQVKISDFNSMINLMFLQYNSTVFHNYYLIFSEHKPLDYVSFIVDINIQEEDYQNVRNILVKDNDKENYFLQELSHILHNTSITNIYTIIDLKSAVNEFMTVTESLWTNYSKYPNITRHFKEQWNTRYIKNIVQYYLTNSL